MNIKRKEEKVFFNTSIFSYADFIEESALEQIENVCKTIDVKNYYIMPDVHAGYFAPIGSVICTDGIIVPELLGNDIGCGISCRYLGLNVNDFNKEDFKKKLDSLFAFLTDPNKFPLNVRNIKRDDKSSNAINDTVFKISDLFYDRLKSLNVPGVSKEKLDRACGTVGGGNHFVEICTDDEGNLFSTVHTGSRFLGQVILDFVTQKIREDKNTFDEVASLFSFLNSEPAAIKEFSNEEISKIQYSIERLSIGYTWLEVFNLINVAQEWAKANRTFINSTIDYFLNPDSEFGSKRVSDKFDFPTYIDCEHNRLNYIRNNNGQNTYIHRKGAALLDNGFGIIAGSQTDGSYIVKGTENNTLNMCSHGAGRVLSRTQARESLDVESERAKLNDAVPYNTFKDKKSLEECSSAYKNIDEVLSLQSDLVTPIAHLKPLMNIKA